MWVYRHIRVFRQLKGQFLDMPQQHSNMVMLDPSVHPAFCLCPGSPKWPLLSPC